jgi:hypothetical protein
MPAISWTEGDESVRRSEACDRYVDSTRVDELSKEKVSGFLSQQIKHKGILSKDI